MAFKRIGYGQIEPNQLSGIKTGQIFASLPLAKNVNVIQNGEFMYYDYVSGTVSAEDSTSVAEPMLVYNEIKIYEPWLSYKDFAMIRVGDNYVTSNAAVGRVTSANVDGTVYGDGSTTGDNITYAKGEILKLKKTDRNTLELSKDGDIDTIAFAIVKVYTMPDGQPGLKVQRVK